MIRTQVSKREGLAGTAAKAWAGRPTSAPQRTLSPPGRIAEQPLTPHRTHKAVHPEFALFAFLINCPADDFAYRSPLVGKRHVRRAGAFRIATLAPKPSRRALVGAKKAIAVSILAPRTRRRHPVVVAALMVAVFAAGHGHCMWTGLSNPSAMMSRSVQNPLLRYACAILSAICIIV
jgi:hypothetical protein